MKPKTTLPLILLLALILRVPGWFTQDVKEATALFQPEEYKQVEAAALTIRGWDSSLLADWDTREAVLRPRGFGVQVGLIGFLLHKIGGMSLETGNLLLIARILSTFYSLFLVLLVYRMTLYLFRSQLAAQLGALLLALFDHNAIYSHYGLPVVAHTFWAFLAVFLMILFYDHFRGRKPAGNAAAGLLVAIPLSVAAGFAIRFDPAPLVIAFVLLILLTLRGKLTLRALWGHTSSFIVLAMLFFLIFTVFQFNPGAIEGAITASYREHFVAHNGIGHWFYTPISYLLAIIAGTGLPVIIVATITFFALSRRGKTFPGYTGFLILQLFLGIEFITIWSMDVPQVSCVSIFMPFIAILGGRGLAGVLMGEPDRAAWQRYGATAFVIGYTLLLTVLSQRNAWNDTRYQARRFLQEQQISGEVAYSPRAIALDMPAEAPLNDAKWLLIHEAYFGRFWKSFSSPFRYPPHCCDQVYNCTGGKTHCAFYQNLLAGEQPEWQRLISFAPVEILPERKLFNRLFGTYDNALGKTILFQKNKQ